jgi:hypothetical protein
MKSSTRRRFCSEIRPKLAVHRVAGCFRFIDIISRFLIRCDPRQELTCRSDGEPFAFSDRQTGDGR